MVLQTPRSTWARVQVGRGHRWPRRCGWGRARRSGRAPEPVTMAPTVGAAAPPDDRRRRPIIRGRCRAAQARHPPTAGRHLVRPAWPETL